MNVRWMAQLPIFDRSERTTVRVRPLARRPATATVIY